FDILAVDYIISSNPDKNGLPTPYFIECASHFSSELVTFKEMHFDIAYKRALQYKNATGAIPLYAAMGDSARKVFENSILRPRAAGERLEALLKQVINPAGAVDREMLRELSRMEGEELEISGNPLESPRYVTIKDKNGHRHFVIDRSGNLIERYVHKGGHFSEALIRNLKNPHQWIILKVGKTPQLYDIYVDGNNIGRVSYKILHGQLNEVFQDITNIAIDEEFSGYRGTGIAVSIVNIFAKWAKEAGKKMIVYNVSHPAMAHIVTRVLEDPRLPDGAPLNDGQIALLPILPNGDFVDDIEKITGVPAPMEIFFDKEGNPHMRQEKREVNRAAEIETFNPIKIVTKLHQLQVFQCGIDQRRHVKPSIEVVFAILPVSGMPAGSHKAFFVAKERSAADSHMDIRLAHTIGVIRAKSIIRGDIGGDIHDVTTNSYVILKTPDFESSEAREDYYKIKGTRDPELIALHMINDLILSAKLLIEGGMPENKRLFLAPGDQMSQLCRYMRGFREHKTLKALADVPLISIKNQEGGEGGDAYKFELRPVPKSDLDLSPEQVSAVISSVLRPKAAGETDWIILLDGARVHRTARIDADCVIEGPNTVIGASAVIRRGSVIRNAIIEPGAYIDKSLIATIDDTDKWMYKPKSEFLVESRQPTVIKKGAKVIRSVVYNSSIGENTQLRQTTVEHSDVGRDNYFKMAKLSLAKTKHNVFATWAELSEGIFGWGFHYDGLALGGPAYFEGIYSNRFPVAAIPDVDLSRMTQKELNSLISDPSRLKAFLGRIRFKSIRGVPHVSIYSPYNIYSVFTGKNLPPESGILEEIRGEPGEQLSQHARNATGPAAIVAANTDVAPRIRGRPDPTRPRDILTNPEYTHQAGFSVSGFNGPMVHGQLRPGAESHSLSPAQINHLWAFTRCPAAVFKMMERIADALPEDQKGRFDDLAVKAIETAFLMTFYDLNAAQSELRRLERRNSRTGDEKKRITSLKKLEKNLTKGLGIYVKNLQENKKHKIWQFKNGQKSASWRHRGAGIWENNYADLAQLAGTTRARYRQYRLKDVLSVSSVKPRRPPKAVLTDMDFAMISGKIQGDSQPTVVIADTARVGKNVRFFGNGKVIIKGDVKLENVVIIANGTVIIDEKTNISLAKIEATEGREVNIGKEVTLNYAHIRNSEVSAHTKGYYVRLTKSHIGERNELNPFADISDTITDGQCIIGHVMRHCNVARGFISRHLPTEAYYLVTPPVSIKIRNTEYI
ncbi:MAG: hypothetical protein HY589_05025, partial [Candidatus Omnitrophica bacterium]|nr:hypothetical protein [Candidatus Omnitrophota bacterium]